MQDTAISLTFLEKGRFVWKVDQKGKNHVLQGRMTFRQRSLDAGTGPGAADGGERDVE